MKKSDLSFQEQEWLENMAEALGRSEEDILQIYERESKNIRYVRFTSGDDKGKVGFYFDTELYPYAVTIYTKDGIILSPTYLTNTKTITKEEYKSEVNK